ncbi:MAG: hypothetical protein JNM85_05695 [Chthonomonas sp.]|nr:hypothetical protein [Chthonomonas sp.]
MAIYLGLDCGGTSTRALALDIDGKTVFEGKSGAANWASTDRDTLRAHLTEALKNVPPPAAVCGCFAGLLTEQDEAEAESMLREITGVSHCYARPDYVAALTACGPRATCCVIAGTGSIVFSRVGDAILKSGGGGPLLGDHGSAFAIARQSLSVALFGSPVVPGVTENFLGAVEALFGTRDPSRVPARIYRESSPASLVGKLAPVIADDYEHGAHYARIAIEEQMRQLAYIVHGHLWTYHEGKRPWRIYLTGGLWRISPVFQRQFETYLRVMAGARDAELYPLETPPVIGAAMLARELAS